MFAPLLHPDLSPAYLSALAWPVAETVLLTLSAMAIAIPGGIAIGLLTVLGGNPGKWLARFLTGFRAVPELTLAIICVIFFGLGPGAALVAIAAYYLASTGKVFGDLFAANANSGPVIALQRTGAGKMVLALWGFVPVSGSQLLVYGGFAFECSLRAAIVVGAVGGGGLGGELASSLASFELGRAATCIIATIALITLLDRMARYLTANPRWLIPLMCLGLAYAAYLAPALADAGHSLRVIGEMFPPAFSAEDWHKLPRLLAETFGMALGATLLAGTVALPLALCASRTTASLWTSSATRIIAGGLRAVPEVIWGLILILLVGIGPLAGLAALFLHSLGSITRLFADAIDATPVAPRRQIARTGADRLVTSIYGAIPQAARPMVTHLLFRFEWNMRMATIIGVIGAGGIGQALFEAQQLLFYDRMLGWLIVTVLLLLAVETVTQRIVRPANTDRRSSHSSRLNEANERWLAEESGCRTHPGLADSPTRI